MTTKRYLDEGAIGELRMIIGRHIHPHFLIPRSGGCAIPAEGSRYLDSGAHANDQVRWYTGDEVTRCSATYRTYSGDASAAAADRDGPLSLAHGVMAQIWMSYEVPQPALGSSDLFT